MMRRRAGIPLLVALSLAGLVLMACPSAPRTVEVYRKDGLHFSHFSDWKVAEDHPLTNNRKVREIVLYGPNEALLMLLCFPETSDVSLDNFAAGVAKGRAETIKKKLGLGPITVGEESGNTTHATIAKIAGEDSAGVQQTFDLDVLGKKIPHQASYYMLHTGGRKMILMAQVAIEHLAATRPGWQQVFDTVAIDP